MKFSLTPIFTLVHLTWYQIHWHYLFIVATIRNKSFLIQHPNHPIPHVVSPLRKTTVYSIPPTPSMQDHLRENYPLPPPARRWQNAAHLLKQFNTTYPSFRPIILDGDIIRPPLQQGMMIYHQGQLIFIQQEHSHWPTCNNYIITTTFCITTKKPFLLFILLYKINRVGVHDKNPLSPFNQTLFLSQFIGDELCLNTSPIWGRLIM